MKTKSGSSRALLFLLPVALAFILMFAVACGGASTYTVTFDLNYSGAQNESVTVEDGDKVTAPADPERDGYRFDGWFADAAATSPWSFDTAISRDTTIYAGWTEVYAVTFDMNYDGGEDLTVQVETGSAIEEPEEPVRAGYAFNGWYTSAEGGAAYNFATPPTRDLTLYARWAEAYTITLVYNYDGAPADGYYYAEKGAVSVGPEDPVRDGYGFNGWYTDEECTTAFSFARPINADTTIYAGWKKQLVMEAEYVDFTGLGGPGYSGSVTGTDMIGWDRDGTLEASNDYYVSYLYRKDITLTFDFVSSATATDADVVIRISAEFYDQTFSSDNYSVVLNGTVLPWSAVTIAGSENPAFIDVTVGKQLTLIEGDNKIELITNNSTAIGGTMAASAPIVDCVKVASSATLTWTPITGNLDL